MRPIKRIIVHHSASPRDTTVEMIRRHHKEVRGFSDIGYHFVIDESGTIHPTRPIEEVGAHAFGANLTSIGICVTGNNTEPDQAWSPEQLAALHELIENLLAVFPGALVLGHRDLPRGTRTACPGLNVTEVLG